MQAEVGNVGIEVVMVGGPEVYRYLKGYQIVFQVKSPTFLQREDEVRVRNIVELSIVKIEADLPASVVANGG